MGYNYGKYHLEQHYLNIIRDLNKRLKQYAPTPIEEKYLYYWHYYIIRKKENKFKKKLFNLPYKYKVGHIDSYGWKLVVKYIQVSLFSIDYIKNNN